MFSDDTNQIRNFIYYMCNTILAPFQIGACLYLIYDQIGPGVFVGLAFSFVTAPLSTAVFSWITTVRTTKMLKTDLRVKLMNEVLTGIRIVKYYAWEKAFDKKITEVRDEEVNILAKMGYVFSLAFGIIFLGAPQFQTVLIFVTYVGLGNQLDSATAFTSLTLFGLMMGVSN